MSGVRQPLLFLSHVLPYPPDSGVALRTYNVLRVLARDFAIDVLAFYRRAARPDATAVESSIEHLRTIARHLTAFPIPQEYSHRRLIRDHLKSIGWRRPYTHFAYESSAFHQALSSCLTRQYSLVHVESLDLVQYLPALQGHRVVCVHHNVESELLRRRAQSEPTRLRRAYIRSQANLVARAEAIWCPRMVLNVTVSPDDARQLAALAPGSKFLVVPNGVDIEYFSPMPLGATTVAFLGGLEWFPNVDALHFFGQEILPRIRESHPSVTIKWIGRASPLERATFAERYGVQVTGYVEDIRTELRDVACTVVPLRIGGGTRLKITTAWAMGIPVVSTTIGCEGLAAQDGRNILVRDGAVDFAAAVSDLLRDGALRTRLADAGRQTAESTYSWDVVGHQIRSAYSAIAT